MASKKSEGPFLVVNAGNLSGGKVGDGLTANYVTTFTTRESLEKYIESQKSSTASFLVFEGVSRVTYDHKVVYGPINAQ